MLLTSLKKLWSTFTDLLPIVLVISFFWLIVLLGAHPPIKDKIYRINHIITGEAAYLRASLHSRQYVQHQEDKQVSS